MSTRKNLNKAMHGVFGVGKGNEPVADAVPVAEEEVLEAAPEIKEDTEHVVPVSNAVVQTQATYIAPGVVIEGNIRVKGDIGVAGELKGDLVADGAVVIRSTIVGNISAGNLSLSDGSITGDISTTGDVVITEKSVVNGNIKAKSLNCSGKVNGDLLISENISLNSSACIIGDIVTATMSVARGASVKGSIEMRSMQ